jgi:hypothetical protein
LTFFPFKIIFLIITQKKIYAYIFLVKFRRQKWDVVAIKDPAVPEVDIDRL